MSKVIVIEDKKAPMKNIKGDDEFDVDVIGSYNIRMSLIINMDVNIIMTLYLSVVYYY